MPYQRISGDLQSTSVTVTRWKYEAVRNRGYSLNVLCELALDACLGITDKYALDYKVAEEIVMKLREETYNKAQERYQKEKEAKQQQEEAEKQRIQAEEKRKEEEEKTRHKTELMDKIHKFFDTDNIPTVEACHQYLKDEGCSVDEINEFSDHINAFYEQSKQDLTRVPDAIKEALRKGIKEGWLESEIIEADDTHPKWIKFSAKALDRCDEDLIYKEYIRDDIKAQYNKEGSKFHRITSHSYVVELFQEVIEEDK